MHILVVEDEPAMAGLLQSALSEEGHLVTVAMDGRKALQFGQGSHFDLVLLDLMLPGVDGFEIVQRLRKMRIQTPILVLTARDAPSDVVKALDSGADDYLTKPFSLEVLLARVRAVSRRGEIPQPLCLQAGNLTLNTATRRVIRENKEIMLTPREYSLLELLMRHKGRVLSRTSMVEAIWGYDSDVEENTLDVFIRLLRQKVELPEAPKLIRTVRGVGYCLQEQTP